MEEQVKDKPVAKRVKRIPDDVRGIGAISKALMSMSEIEQFAAMEWAADRFLGMKLVKRHS